MSSMDKKERKRMAILEVLRAAETPLSSQRIAQALLDAGETVSERTVRLYLQVMCDEGLIEKTE